MTKWEYRTITIKYDRKRHKNWVLERSGEPPLVGLHSILEAYGSDGWELVNLDAEHYDVSPGFGTWHMDPVVHRATFKRPVEGSL